MEIIIGVFLLLAFSFVIGFASAPTSDTRVDISESEIIEKGTNNDVATSFCNSKDFPEGYMTGLTRVGEPIIQCYGKKVDGYKVRETFNKKLFAEWLAATERIK